MTDVERRLARQIKELADALQSTNAALQSTNAQIERMKIKVGGIYFGGLNPENPATALGYGVWTRIKDRFLLAAGDTYAAGTTGGAASVSLTAANNGFHTHPVIGYTDYVTSNGPYYYQTVPGANTYGTLDTAPSGSGTPFSIMPLYKACYIWERTA